MLGMRIGPPTLKPEPARSRRRFGRGLAIQRIGAALSAGVCGRRARNAEPDVRGCVRRRLPQGRELPVKRARARLTLAPPLPLRVRPHRRRNHTRRRGHHRPPPPPPPASAPPLFRTVRHHRGAPHPACPRDRRPSPKPLHDTGGRRSRSRPRWSRSGRGGPARAPLRHFPNAPPIIQDHQDRAGGRRMPHRPPIISILPVAPGLAHPPPAPRPPAHCCRSPRRTHRRRRLLNSGDGASVAADVRACAPSSVGVTDMFWSPDRRVPRLGRAAAPRPARPPPRPACAGATTPPPTAPRRPRPRRPRSRGRTGARLRRFLLRFWCGFWLGGVGGGGVGAGCGPGRRAARPPGLPPIPARHLQRPVFAARVLPTVTSPRRGWNPNISIWISQTPGVRSSV